MKQRFAEVMPFALQHADGSTVRGFRYAVDKPGKRPAVVLCHGFNGCCAGTEKYGETFASAGIDCIVFDFRGGSLKTTSDGKLSEMMTIATECEDLRLVSTWVHQLPEVDSQCVALMGESQGGLVSTIVAEEHPELFAALVLWYPALMIPEASRQRLARGETSVFGIQLSPSFDSQAAEINPWEHMPLFTKPVLLIHGDRDRVVPLSVSQRAAQLFPNAALTIVPGGSHGFDGNDLHECLRESATMVLKATA